MRKGVGVGRREGEVGGVVRGVLGLVVDDVSVGGGVRVGGGKEEGADRVFLLVMVVMIIRN